jgi:hypothetical protein
MTFPLVVVSDEKTATGDQVVVENYNRHPVPCRFGIWVGLEHMFTERVTLSWEHGDDENVWVGWSLNGVTFSDPGNPPDTEDGRVPLPCPGLPSVLVFNPVDGVYHTISFLSSSGDPRERIWVQVLYRNAREPGLPLHQGPSTAVWLSGSDYEWPEPLLEEERKCLSGFWKFLRQYVEIAHVNPGDPVEFLKELPDQVLVELRGAAEMLEKIDAKKQPALADALRGRIVAILRSRVSAAPKIRLSATE